jgi:hypothetical protein
VGRKKKFYITIDLHSEQEIYIIMQMSIIEELYEDIKKRNDINKTSVLCLRTKQIYFKMKAFRVTNSILYKNEGLNLTMIVKKDDVEFDWIELKKSSIPNSGFGIYALRNFEKDEVVTVYLGDVVQDGERLDYAFGVVNGRPEWVERSGLIREYWLAHRINHGRNDTINVAIGKDYKVIATRKILKGEELFLDYNRDVFCSNCHVESCFANNVITNTLCSECNKVQESNKHCEVCLRYICTNCYYKSQIGSAI